MRTIQTLAGAAALSLLLFSCNRADRSYTANNASAAVAPTAAMDETDVSKSESTHAAAGEGYGSPDRKVIRRADFRCRVKDVFAATTHIENTVKAAGGLIADSKTENEPNDTRTLPYSSDSLRQVQTYTTTAQLTLRIPVQNLDSVLNDIAAQSAFINSRHLQLSDVSLKYLSNELKNRAAQGYANNGRAGMVNDERDASLIDRRIENLDLMDNVRFATLTISLYQPERIDAVMVANTAALMQPGIGQRLRTALGGGWLLVQHFALLLVYVWPLLLAGIAVLILLKRRKVRRVRLMHTA